MVLAEKHMVKKQIKMSFFDSNMCKNVDFEKVRILSQWEEYALVNECFSNM